MSTLPPNYFPRESFTRPMIPTQVNMALTQTQTKPKSATIKPNATPKQKTQMHRRSRTGCYTCRLRRKKCDEGTPMCTACRHLGLACEYKRPMWWSNNDARRTHKEEIKMIIKRKKLSEKSSSSHSISTGTLHSPPGLSHSLPTSATLSDSLGRTRSGSIESHFSHGLSFGSPPTAAMMGGGGEFNSIDAQLHPDFMFTAFSPYEIDVKTERQMYVNDVPTISESTVSTFSTFHTPPPPGTVIHSAPMETTEWAGQQPMMQHERSESMSEELLNLNFFDFAHGTPTVETVRQEVALDVDEADQPLLDHFLRFVMPCIFPILESNQHGSVASDLILPALQSNRGYLHCCLSIAAQHLKSTLEPGAPTDELDQAIMRHRYETVSTLCEALNRDENHQQILDAALSQIFLQCIVGRADDSLPDIPWHKHFEAAISLVQKLDLPRAVADPSNRPAHPPFHMTLASWIDILGSTMLGRSPTFAHTYREKLINPDIASLGLRELMGCDDRVMYLVSEIACLDSLKKAGMDDITLCHHVHTLGEQIGYTEAAEPPLPPRMPFNANGSLSPKQLSLNVTAAFRLAARIYLCSLVPGFSPSQESCVGLVERLTQVLQFIPAGNHGFDRSLVWVYVIAGSVALPNSSFRAMYRERVAQLGSPQSQLGSFGRATAILSDVWAQTDAAAAASTSLCTSPNPSNPGKNSTTSEPVPYVHWRDAMQMKRWDFLLI